MKAVVVGAGAWGLPAAAELARRGHEVVLVDRHGPANGLSSSTGPTRLWRLADPEPARVRLSRRGVAAMDRLAERAGIPVNRRLGLLWRDKNSLPRLLASLRAEEIEHQLVAEGDVGAVLPGLRPDGRDAVWLPDAGVVLAADSLSAQLQLFTGCGGELVVGRTVTSVRAGAARAEVRLDGGTRLEADVAVLAPGPGAPRLLAGLGIDVPLRPFAEQVVHLGNPEAASRYDDVPCLFDGPTGDDDGIYAMPSPGIGYKIGLDRPLRPLGEHDQDRTPDPERTALIARYARRALGFLTPHVVDEQVCTWTDSPDGRFVIDRVGPIVLACGDSGEGFKYSALMGEILADLAEGKRADDDVAALSLRRLAGVASGGDWTPTTLGSH